MWIFTRLPAKHRKQALVAKREITLETAATLQRVEVHRPCRVGFLAARHPHQGYQCFSTLGMPSAGLQRRFSRQDLIWGSTQETGPTAKGVLEVTLQACQGGLGLE